MIVFTHNFVLSAGVAGHARIGWHTWTRSAGVSTSASNAGLEAPADAPLRPDTYEFWRSTSMPAVWTVDLGTARDADYVALAGHTLGTMPASVLVQYSTDGATWVAFASETQPATDAALMFIGPMTTARFWRLTVTGAAPPRIAVVYIGQVLEMPVPIYGGHAPLPLSRDTTLAGTWSEGGQMLGQRVIRHGVTGSAAFRHLDPAWYRAHFDRFVRSARRFPYFFAWRPSRWPNEVAYVRTEDDIRPVNMGLGPGWMEVAWAMKGLGHAD